MTSSAFYVFKSITRNKRRSSTLMMGIIISLAIISGVLFYVDSTNDTLVQNALGNVMIDAAVFQPTLNVTEMNDLAAFIDSNVS